MKPARERGRAPRGSRRATVALVAVGVAVVAVAAVGGFLVGGAHATPPEEARDAGVLARERGEARAFRAAYTHGKRRGRGDGLREGRLAGKRAAEEEVERRAALAAPPATEEPDSDQRQGEGDCPPGQQPITRMGVTYCGRPGPARPEDCPPGSEPVGQTGACAPKEE